MADRIFAPKTSLLAPSPKNTASACSSLTCEGCELQGRLMCIHTPTDLADFLVLFLVWAIPFFAGMILGEHWWGLAIWAGLAMVFFGYVEALVLCRHCPAYLEPGSTLRCHANWGLPKFPKFSPRPLNRTEKVVWLIYAATLFLWFVPFFIAGQQWLLLLMNAAATVTFVWTLWRTQCNRCYNLSCPLNRVPADVHTHFFQHYPAFAEGWGKREQSSTDSPLRPLVEDEVLQEAMP
jgi:hypothetical protein